MLDQLKRDARTANVPVVMLSNESDPATMATCARTGAVAWWNKSTVPPAELCRRVRKLLDADQVLA